jgi:serine/threonine-protein kinase
MGVVIKAVHVLLDEPVAIKLLNPSLADSSNANGRFLREARATVRLSSDHIARVLDVGLTEDGSPYMALEYLEGADLGAVLDKEGPLPIERAVRYILQACVGVGEAHAQEIIHRDIKPSNLFVAKGRDGVERIKVLDFGISKIKDEDGKLTALTKSGGALGSPMYMAPEQLRGAKDADTRVDIWGLGAALSELLTGLPPFLGDNMHAMLAAIAADPPRQLRKARPELDPALEAIIYRCLEKDRERRFASVAELAQALRPFGGDEGALASDRVASTSRSSRQLQVATTEPAPRPEGHQTLDVPAAPQVPSAIAATQLDGTPEPAPSDAELRKTGAPMAEGSVSVPPAPEPARRSRAGLLIGGAVAVGIAAVLGVMANARSQATAERTPGAATVSATPSAAPLPSLAAAATSAVIPSAQAPAPASAAASVPAPTVALPHASAVSAPKGTKPVAPKPAPKGDDLGSLIQDRR